MDIESINELVSDLFDTEGLNPMHLQQRIVEEADAAGFSEVELMLAERQAMHLVQSAFLGAILKLRYSRPATPHISDVVAQVKTLFPGAQVVD